VVYTPFTEPKTEKHPKTKRAWFLPKYNGTECGELTWVRIRSLFQELTFLAEYDKAWQYAKWKYDIATLDLDSIAYDATLGTRAHTSIILIPFGEIANCKLGTGAFADENWCASSMGHEQVHGSQGYWYIQWHSGEDPEDRNPMNCEVPAYQWEIDNAPGTGISASELQTVTAYRDYYNGTTNTPPPD